MKHSPKKQPERSWVEICCFGYSCLQHFWPKTILRKWLNIRTTESDFSADADEGESDSDSFFEENDGWGRESGRSGQESRFKGNKGDEIRSEFNGISSKTLPIIRRRKSETLRAQYINTKELRICVGTWNVGGKLPPDDLDIKDWLNVDEPADIYVLGIQEIVPLHAGNVLGAEDSRPVRKWEYIIRDTLNEIRTLKTKFKCYSDPPSPTRFRPLDDIPDIEDEIIPETDSDDDDEEVHPLDETFDNSNEIKDGPTSRKIELICTEASKSPERADLEETKDRDLQRQFSSSILDRLNRHWMEGRMENSEAPVARNMGILTKTLSASEKIGLGWPEPPLNLLAQLALERPNSVRSVESFRRSKSLRTYNAFKSSSNKENKGSSEIALLTDLDLESIMRRKRRSPFVRIVSKQMVGVFLSIWVRRSFRRHIHNLKVSTVGVGVMGYIGNKGSISVSMSIYQTLFCFICTHLTSGEKDGDEHRRNADVKEIHRRTQFHPASSIGFPKTIRDHERIIWLGDLNYRINLSYEKTRELVSKKEWSKLVEKDQLIQELKKGRAFDGWTEGALNFPPTYKYEFNSEKYCGEDSKAGRRTPAWCDRILSFGKGMKLLKYERVEHMLSDHRPVMAIYMADVEVFSPKKLQKALTFTDAELEDGEVIADLDINVGISHLIFGQDIPILERRGGMTV